MISRTLVGVIALVLVGSAGPARPVPQSEAAPSHIDRPTTRRPAPPDVDLLSIRNIFRYVDETALESAPATVDETDEPAAGASTPSLAARVRIVGLVHRAGTPVVALAIDGEVVLLRVGETGAGFTVLGIRDEAVRVRDSEGNETTLDLP